MVIRKKGTKSTFRPREATLKEANGEIVDVACFMTSALLPSSAHGQRKLAYGHGFTAIRN